MAENAEKCFNDFGALAEKLAPIINKLDESGQKLLLNNIKDAVNDPGKVDIDALSKTLSTHGVSAADAKDALVQAQGFAQACPATSKDAISMF